MEITRWLQLIGGVRFDRFDMSATDMNTGIFRDRVDNLMSPQAAVIVKPIDNLSIYGTYSVSYLPASGDQFSSLTHGTLILQPQKFVNTEVGVKWNINPKLLFSTAIYNLNRTNQPIADGNNSGILHFHLAHHDPWLRSEPGRLRHAAWQSSLAYAYTDARITRARRRRTVVPGNRVQLVPYNQFAWWNKYQFNDDVGRGSRRDLLRRFLCLVGRHREAAGLRSLRHGALSEDQRELEGAAQRREYLQQGILGVGGRQQQHLAGPVAHLPPVGKGDVLIRRDSEFCCCLKLAAMY